MASVTNASMSLIDRKGRTSTITFTGDRITAANLTQEVADFGTLQLTTLGVSLGEQSKNSLNLYTNNFAATRPTDENALIERKWLVSYMDTQMFLDAPTNTIANNGYGKTFWLEIPIADTTGLIKADSDEADLTAAAWVAWIAAFEAYQKSPYGGSVEVQRVEIVGR